MSDGGMGAITSVEMMRQQDGSGIAAVVAGPCDARLEARATDAGRDLPGEPPENRVAGDGATQICNRRAATNSKRRRTTKRSLGGVPAGQRLFFAVVRRC